MTHSFLDLGTRWQWGGDEPFGLAAADRARHLYIIGQTGTGKSTLLGNLLAQSIEAGEGVALIDPHGDLADETLDRIPGRRIDDVVVLDPSDHAHVPAFNPFYRVPLDERPLVTSNLVATFRHVWSDSWGPRLEHVLRNSVRLALDAPDAARPSLLSVARLLVERSYRERLLAHAQDPRVVSFFRDEFEAWTDRFASEALAPVQNKLGAVIANPFVRNIIGQWRSTIELPKIMAAGRVLVVRLPKGRLGEDQANLIGALIVSEFLHAAMGRRDQRRPFHLFIDEFQNFTTDSFATILAEARKYGLTLTLGHQYIDQVPEAIQAAVFGNVGNVVSFRVGAEDARRLAAELGDVQPHVLRDLERGQVIARLMSGRVVSQSFIGQTHPLAACRGSYQKAVAKSRRAYSMDRCRVESRLARWLAR